MRVLKKSLSFTGLSIFHAGIGGLNLLCDSDEFMYFHSEIKITCYNESSEVSNKHCTLIFHRRCMHNLI